MVAKKEIFFFKNYIEESKKTYSNINLKLLNKISIIILKKIRSNRKIFVCGNGGSASISNHFLCDFNRGIKLTSKKKLYPKIISLSNSVETITAIGNDINFENIFVDQLENYISKNDLLIVFSCSGKSKNILKAIKFAKKKKIKIIKFFGFSKKSYENKNEITLSINSNNYGISEDVFQASMHMISQFIRSKFIKKFNFKKIRL